MGQAEPPRGRYGCGGGFRGAPQSGFSGKEPEAILLGENGRVNAAIFFIS
jgi:hypothetical protein